MTAVSPLVEEFTYNCSLSPFSCQIRVKPNRPRNKYIVRYRFVTSFPFQVSSTFMHVASVTVSTVGLARITTFIGNAGAALSPAEKTGLRRILVPATQAPAASKDIVFHTRTAPLTLRPHPLK